MQGHAKNHTFYSMALRGINKIEHQLTEEAGTQIQSKYDSYTR